MIDLDFLERIEVFKDLNDDQLKAVQACCGEAEFQREERLFGIGEAAACLWAVVKGDVTIEEDAAGDAGPGGDSLSSLSETKAFGWSALVPPYTYRLSARCASRRCEVIQIDGACLRDRFEADPEMGYRVLGRLLPIIGGRFYRLHDEVVRRRGEEIMSRW